MKSHERTLVNVAECLIKDAAALCAVTNYARDLDVLKSRTEHEGLSFLTISLPSLGKDFERCLALGRIEPDLFRSFKKRLKTPAFLQGFFAQVFDTATGVLLDDPKIESIVAIRQIAGCFKKLLVPCTPRRVNKALEEFQQCESVFEKALDPGDVEYFLNVSRVLWSMSIGGKLTQLSPLDTIPKHGPGSTVEKISGNQKFFHQTWHDRLEPYFPLMTFAFPNEGCYGTKAFEQVKVVPEGQEKPVRVVPVPKTLKAPRIIAIEPVCMQYTQQAVSATLIRALETSEITGGHINFDDQTVNQHLAMVASRTGRYATLDLSSASDRVPFSLAIGMFDCAPEFQGAITACRSTRAELPDGTILPLRKFASMGSALCFPVEAMYFYTICVAALLKSRKLPVTPRAIKKVTREVWVYGDDIIVPASHAAVVCDYLHKYFCKVNTAKSFWTGKFRESCGTDAYDGELVTPVYLRRLCPVKRTDASELISWVKTSNFFYKKGYWLTADLLYKKVRGVIGALPIADPKTPGLCLESVQPGPYVPPGIRQRRNKALQRDEVSCWQVVCHQKDDEISGYPALMKCLLRLEKGSEEPQEVDEKHLLRSVRNGSVALKRRWTALT